MKQICLLVCVVLLGCPADNCNSSPTAPVTSTVTTTTVSPAPPPRVDEPPELDALRLYSSFALVLRDEATIAAVVTDAARKGWKTPRVCCELEGWPGMFSMALASPALASYLPRGPSVDTPEALEGVARVLDVTSRMPGISVLLVPICTMKENGRSFEEIKAWTAKVAEVAAQYNHVLFEAVNEHWHPRSSLREEAKIVELLEILRPAGHLVGTDDNFNPGRIRYNAALRPHVDFPSAHPWRNPDPNRREIREMVARNGGFLVLSETTSYATSEQMELYFPNGSGLVTSDRAQIELYGHRCKAEGGCVFCFHSIDGLKVDGPYTWMPDYSAM